MSTEQRYGPWPVSPTPHQPAVNPPMLEADLLADAYQGLGPGLLIILDALHLSGYQIDKQGPVSAATIANIRAGRTQPSSELICWLVNVYPQVNLDFLFREKGAPLLKLTPAVEREGRLSEQQLDYALNSLRKYLRKVVYPALLDKANVRYDETTGDVITLSDRALAINLHREFVEACGPYQADWWGEYFKELGYLFTRLHTTPDNMPSLFTDRVFLSLLHAYAA